MKLAVILPGDYDEGLCEQKEKYLNHFASVGTQIKAFPSGGTKSIRSLIDFVLIAPGAVEQAIKAEKAGFDGVALQGT
jgi:hypothetical protein